MNLEEIIVHPRLPHQQEREVSSPHIELPPKTVIAVKNGIKNVARYYCQGPLPEATFLLERSAPLAYVATARALGAAGIDAPPTHRLSVGKGMHDRFLAQHSTAQVGIYDTGKMRMVPKPSDLRKYQTTLAQDVEIDHAIKTMAAYFQSLKKGENHTLVFADDAVEQGITLGLTLPWIISQAAQQSGVSGLAFETNAGSHLKDMAEAMTGVTPGQDAKLTVKLLSLIPDSNWLLDTIGHSFSADVPSLRTIPKAQDYLTKEYLIEIAKGATKTETGLVEPLTRESQLYDMADQVLQRRQQRHPEESLTNPAPRLIEKYGVAGLLAVHEQVWHALEDVGAQTLLPTYR